MASPCRRPLRRADYRDGLTRARHLLAAAAAYADYIGGFGHILHDGAAALFIAPKSYFID